LRASQCSTKNSPGHATKRHGPTLINWISAGDALRTASAERPSAAAWTRAPVSPRQTQSHSAVRTSCRGAPALATLHSGTGSAPVSRARPRRPETFALDGTIARRAARQSHERAQRKAANAAAMPVPGSRRSAAPRERYSRASHVAGSGSRPRPSDRSPDIDAGRAFAASQRRANPGKSAVISVESSCSTVGCMPYATCNRAVGRLAIERATNTGTSGSVGPLGSWRFVPTPSARATASPEFRRLGGRHRRARRGQQLLRDPVQRYAGSAFGTTESAALLRLSRQHRARMRVRGRDHYGLHRHPPGRSPRFAA
jgi:hypothetical protein